MVKPDTFLIQEIKTLPAKAKVRPLPGRLSSPRPCPGFVFVYPVPLPALLTEAYEDSSPRCSFFAGLLHSTVKPMASLPLCVGLGPWVWGLTRSAPLLLDPDMVAIRHTACSAAAADDDDPAVRGRQPAHLHGQRESTSYWLQPSCSPAAISAMKPGPQRYKAAATSKALHRGLPGEGTRGWTAMDAREPRGWASLVGPRSLAPPAQGREFSLWPAKTLHALVARQRDGDLS